MIFEPHAYQQFCIEYLKEHEIAALFLDMGLGKTSITLTAIHDLMLDSFEVSRVLVVAPVRVAKDTWPKELEKWDHLRHLTMAVAVGTPKQREAAVRQDAMITVINRENLKWLTEFLHQNRMPFRYDMLVIDELSGFKSYKSQRFKLMRQLRAKVHRIVGLTGTPAPNGLMDLWAEIGLLDRGERLGRFIGPYRERYFTASSYNPQTGIVYRYEPKPSAEKEIYDRISDISISMKALDYLDMPACVMNTVPVYLDDSERRVYEQLKKEFILPMAEGGDVDAANAAALSGKLLQLAGGAVYDECHQMREFHSRKLDALEDLIEAANGQPVLVAYWYQHEHDRIHARFAKVGVRDLRSEADISDWNAGKIPVALIHPAAAGHGLNLQEGGHILVWYSMIWNLELYQQTNGRLWRQGQTERVSIHHIVTADTLDEDVMDALRQKNMTQEKLMTAVRARVS